MMSEVVVSSLEKRGGKGLGKEEYSTRTGVFILDTVVHGYLTSTVSCI